jgi:D-allose transport system substrate-binding protein
MLIAAPARAEDEYVFLLPNRANPYWNTIAEGIRESGAEHGVKVTVYAGDSDTNAEEQLNTCSVALVRKPIFVGIAAAKVSTGVQCLKKAVDLGIKVGGLDSTLPIEDAAKGGVTLSYAVGSDNYAIGEKAAEYVRDLLKGKSAEVLVIEGAVGSSAGVLRPRGFIEKIKIIAPQAKIITSVSGEWDRLKAMNLATDTMQRNPNLSIIFAANDPMALGAVEGLKALGKLSQVTVIGVDGTADARKSIVAGELNATIAQLPYLVGKRAVDLAVEVRQGKPVTQKEITETPVLTKAILSQKDSPALKYVR